MIPKPINSSRKSTSFSALQVNSYINSTLSGGGVSATNNSNSSSSNNNSNANPLSSSLTLFNINTPQNSNSIGVFYNWGEKYSHKPQFNTIVPTVKLICNGFSHSIALTDQGEVYSWGDNRSLQLGAPVPGNANYSDTPIQVGKQIFQGLKVRSIACGGCFSAVVLDNGLLYTWGVLTEGSKYTDAPTRVDLVKGVTSVSVGINHVAVVAETTTGEKRAVFTWGSNKKGQLGVQGEAITNAPRRVTLGSKAMTVSCGEEFTCAIVEGNEVFVWGNNKNRQICNNTDEIIYIPVKPFLGRDIVELASSRTFVVGRSSNGEIVVWGNNENVVRAGDSDKWISFPSKIKQIAVGLNHILALTERGEIYSSGAGEDGQLGHDEKKSSLTQYKLVSSLIGRNVLSVCAWGRCSGAIVEPGNFRVELSECMRKEENNQTLAPLFIRKLVNYLRGDNSKQEGIFRLNGSIARLDELEKKLDQNEKFTISKFEPYDAADIIKRYFKTLPEPLLTNQLCQKFEKEYINTHDQTQRKKMMHEWIGLLPKENRNALIYILAFLDEIAYSQVKHQKNNAMSVKNLALVFAPNLLTRGEIGNDEVIEDMILCLPEILRKYPEVEPLLIVDQATECLTGSRTSYIIDHWTRVIKERPDTARTAFFNHQVLSSIINSIVNGLLQMKSSRSNSLTNGGTQSPMNLNGSPNISPESSPAPRVSTQSMSLNNLIYNSPGSSANSTPGSPSVNSSSNAILSAGFQSGSNMNFLINRQVSSPLLMSMSLPSLTLHSSNSQLNLIEQSRYYEQVLSLVLSPIIPVKNIIKVLPSIFEISQANDLFIKLLLLNQFEHFVPENIDELIQLELAGFKEINNNNIKEKLGVLCKNMHDIVHHVFYMNECIEYWKREQINITLYSNQILSYFKWWGEHLDKSFKDIDEKVMRFKKDFDKLENDQTKIQKQLTKLQESQKSQKVDSDLLKSEFEIWTLTNQMDILEKKLEYTNQQMSKFQQEKLNVQQIYDQFKPHLTVVEEFIKTSVNQSLVSYLEKLNQQKTTVQTQFPIIFSQFIDMIFQQVQFISKDPQQKEILLSSLHQLSQLMFVDKIHQKYILSLELETKFNSLKKKCIINKSTLNYQLLN
ncbi:regulator of chromosome condensation domain-containing protein [Tieghemostelium lacteum]|uniref:Regulator of chromosome condensation domain-containing protein n=1 Tax=Tieghemostelium lacteum TaxID=361077 RepID=A0A151ZCJ0_TIELA|nr:regulator of chromosome condensation domain-containing protein [Tieghemostelium lacteum]|eukprot:KYQ91667.1 regulator of chromosome condensation domain-containing protein [Tieghemostelium lacteum]